MISLISKYWTKKEARKSWLLVGLALACIALDVAGLVYLNHWRGEFWGAIEQRQTAQFWHQIMVFTGVAFVLVYNNATLSYITGHIALQWRQWLNWHFFQNWGGKSSNGVDNPDQRIAEDINKFTSDTTTLVSGLISNLATAIVFSVVLWQLSELVSPIPGLLVWAAYAYTIIGSLITFVIGKKLVNLSFINQKAEADYRYTLVEVRQTGYLHAKSQWDLNNQFDKIIFNVKNILSRQKKISMFSYGYNQAAAIFPIIIVAPIYFLGKITFGLLMQSVNAIISCQDALSYLINSYSFIAYWRSTCNRLLQFEEQLKNEKR